MPPVLSGTIFPMDPFGEDATFAGNMHIIITGFNIIFVVLAILMIGVGVYKNKEVEFIQILFNNHNTCYGNVWCLNYGID